MGDFSRKWVETLADEGQYHPTPNQIWKGLEEYQLGVLRKKVIDARNRKKSEKMINVMVNNFKD